MQTKEFLANFGANDILGVIEDCETTLAGVYHYHTGEDYSGPSRLNDEGLEALWEALEDKGHTVGHGLYLSSPEPDKIFTGNSENLFYLVGGIFGVNGEPYAYATGTGAYGCARSYALYEGWSGAESMYYDLFVHRWYAGQYDIEAGSSVAVRSVSDCGGDWLDDADKLRFWREMMDVEAPDHYALQTRVAVNWEWKYDDGSERWECDFSVAIEPHSPTALVRHDLPELAGLRRPSRWTGDSALIEAFGEGIFVAEADAEALHKSVFDGKAKGGRYSVDTDLIYLRDSGVVVDPEGEEVQPYMYIADKVVQGGWA